MFTWKDDGATGTAALILFVTLCHLAVERAALPKVRARGGAVVPRSRVGQIFATYAPHLLPVQQLELVEAVTAAGGLDEVEELPETTVDYIAHASYDELGQLTGLSRKLIAAGLRLLIERLMIERVGSPRSGDYRITDLEIGFRWASCPGRSCCLQPKRVSSR